MTHVPWNIDQIVEHREALTTTTYLFASCYQNFAFLAFTAAQKTRQGDRTALAHRKGEMLYVLTPVPEVRVTLIARAYAARHGTRCGGPVHCGEGTMKRRRQVQQPTSLTGLQRAAGGSETRLETRAQGREPVGGRSGHPSLEATARRPANRPSATRGARIQARVAASSTDGSAAAVNA